MPESTDTPAERSGRELIDGLLDQMTVTGASDLFVAVGRPPAVRINGQMVTSSMPPFTGEQFEQFLAHALTPIARQRLDASGDLDMGYSLAGREQRFRFNIARQRGGWQLVARALPTGDLDVRQLGLPGTIRELAMRPRGLVLVTGATGSGKSTTMAAIVHAINLARASHIITIEDPIEFVHRDINSRITQREVGVDTPDFHSGLRHALRQSPDVILIGEMRDAETMQVALSAALTGHLVFATLHTVDATQTLQRILAYFP
ncbi:MAG: type IV pilus twitching motility protein PilT, partial [Planctomycetota bacterium]